jgi:hypothetical protein
MCEQIADVLKDNHTIYGFHFAGHCGYVDNLGFYEVRQFVQDQQQSYTNYQVCINGVEPIIETVSIIPKNNSNCWICEGWNEVDFTWDLGYFLSFPLIPF